MAKACTNEHTDPIVSEREEANGEHKADPTPAPIAYTQHENILSGEQVAVEVPNEEPLEAGTQRQYSIMDFELIRVIGRGSYAKVLMVELKKTRRIYAMKVNDQILILYKSLYLF